MRRWKIWTDDTGSAALEFVTVGFLLLVPMVYLVVVVAVIQSAALAAEGAARQSARVFVQSTTVADARAAVTRAVEFALADHGVDPAAVDVTIRCSPRPNDCFVRQGLVTVDVNLEVPLPLAPASLDGDFPLSVPIEASATQQVSRFWGAG